MNRALEFLLTKIAFTNRTIAQVTDARYTAFIYTYDHIS